MSARRVSTIDLVRQLWAQAGLPGVVLENTVERGNVVLVNEAEVGGAVRSSFQLTAVAQACCVAVGLMERLRRVLVAGEDVDKVVLDKVMVDARHAVGEYKGWVRLHLGEERTKEAMLKRSIAPDSGEGRRTLGIDQHAVADWDALAGLYRAKSTTSRSVPGIVRIHTNFPHHKLGILQLLNLAPATARWTDERIHEQIFSQVGRQDLQTELENWDAFEFEQAAQERGLCVTAFRSRDEWEASEMGRALKSWMGENGGSAFRISRIAPTGKQQAVPAKPQGSQLKVIDMSRVIAGPISTRTLAAYGADVVLLSSRGLPNLPLRELDTARGKRTAFVDLPRGQLPEEMRKLVEGADVFSQAYRPQGLVERGLSAEDVQSIRPGIVYAELRAFGFTGPWKDRRAYDSLTQTACGINYLEGLSYQQYQAGGGAVEPKALPVQALDYTAGLLMCFATLACKCRALLEGSSDEGWKVQLSLASTAEWIISLGQIQGGDAWRKPRQDLLEDQAQLAAMMSSYKVRGLAQDVSVLAVRHASIAEEEDASSTEESGSRWTVPSGLGVDRLEWL